MVPSAHCLSLLGISPSLSTSGIRRRETNVSMRRLAPLKSLSLEPLFDLIRESDESSFLVNEGASLIQAVAPEPLVLYPALQGLQGTTPLRENSPFSHSRMHLEEVSHPILTLV